SPCESRSPPGNNFILKIKKQRLNASTAKAVEVFCFWEKVRQKQGKTEESRCGSGWGQPTEVKRGAERVSFALLKKLKKKLKFSPPHFIE
ncbi:hypothetical protein RYD26_04995, partial [Pasteurellaceae bacterium LIM206]|nr:hypothetical protein [Pasteurellaceae bacterium LIM206]